jgi:predicted amidophosphoribosyltransferase
MLNNSSTIAMKKIVFCLAALPFVLVSCSGPLSEPKEICNECEKAYKDITDLEELKEKHKECSNKVIAWGFENMTIANENEAEWKVMVDQMEETYKATKKELKEAEK